MRNNNILFIVTLLLAACTSEFCQAQSCLDSLLTSRLYSDPANIINGRKWLYIKNYSGSSLLIPDYWPKADIYYDGSFYTGQLMNFDLLKGEMVIYHPEAGNEKFIVLNNDLLAGFSFTDTVTFRKYNYVCKKLPGTSQRLLYEDASEASLSFFIRPLRNIEPGLEGSGHGRIIESFEYYLKDDSLFTRIISVKQMLKLLPGHEAALKRYVRDKRFKVDVKHPDIVRDLVRFYSHLQ